MKISIVMTLLMAVLFAGVSFYVAYTGFSSLGTVTDPTQLSGVKGFAWFWTALGIIATIFGGLSYWMLKRIRA